MFNFKALAIALVAFGGSVAQASAFDNHERWFYVVNNSNQTIVEVYASDVGRSDWGRDILGRRVVDAHEQLKVEPYLNRGYCRFDIQVVFEDDSEEFLDNINLCEATEIVINRRGFLSARY